MMVKSIASRIIGLIAVSAMFLASAAYGAEIRVMTSGGFAASFDKLVPLYERESANKIITIYGSSMGGASDSIPSRLTRGEQTDIVIMADTALDELIKAGKVVPSSRVDLVRSKIGMVVRAGAQKPDISTVEAFKRTLLEAKSIAYSASASGTYLSTELFQRLGIANQILPKSMLIKSIRVGTVVARGDAEIGFQQISELLPIPGVDFVGPIPPEVQKVTVFSAGIAVGAKELDASRALIKFLTSPAAVPIIIKDGLEPIAH